jgi:hypothetical protein
VGEPLWAAAASVAGGSCRWSPPSPWPAHLHPIDNPLALPGAAWVVAIALARPCLPVATAVAVLRDRLWDLDRLVGRTVTYGLLTLVLGLGYAGAALFQPLRRRIQALVDRTIEPTGPPCGCARPARPRRRSAWRS